MENDQLEALKQALKNVEHSIDEVEKLSTSHLQLAAHYNTLRNSVRTMLLAVKFINATEGDDKKLTRTEAKRLNILNEALYGLECFLVRETKSIASSAQDRLKASNSEMIGFEVDIDLDFCLREDDPEWGENSDNVIAQLHPGEIVEGKIPNKTSIRYGTHHSLTSPVLLSPAQTHLFAPFPS